MDGKCESASDTEHGSEGVGARTQVGFLTEKLKSVALFLQRVGLGVGSAKHLKALCLHFAGLSLAH